MERQSDPFSSKSTRGYRLTMVTQLLQAVEVMHRPEELFQWLAYTIVQRFDIALIQFWTRQSDLTVPPSAQLRALAYRDRSLPANVISEKLTATIEHLPKERNIFPPQLVEQVFPQFQATLFKRYGLSYCAYCLIDKNVRFTPSDYAFSHEPASMGLTFIAFMLLQHYPVQDLIPTVGMILEQAVGIAEKHRLLLPVTADSGHLPVPDRLSSSQMPIPQELHTALLRLIPRPKQDERLLVSSNPFAPSVTILDKQALRLYTAIDGRRTVDELRSTGMTLQEIQAALRMLLNLHCIEIYTPEGQLVDASLLFK
jgi:hypothetical protein